MNDSINPQTALRRVLEIFPGAQRVLFRRFHIGGCASCGFEPEETLEALCRQPQPLAVPMPSSKEPCASGKQSRSRT